MAPEHQQHPHDGSSHLHGATGFQFPRKFTFWVTDHFLKSDRLQITYRGKIQLASEIAEAVKALFEGSGAHLLGQALCSSLRGTSVPKFLSDALEVGRVFVVTLIKYTVGVYKMYFWLCDELATHLKEGAPFLPFDWE